MRYKKSMVGAFVFLLGAVPLFAQTAYVRTTLGTPSAAPYCIPWIDSGAKAGVNLTAAPANYLQILPDSQYQTVKAWGGTIQEKGWEALKPLSAAGKDSVLRALFDTSGCNISFLRVPIGCCDFDINENPISLNDSAGDYDMSAFSLHRDSTRKIPYIKMAQAINPNLKFWGCPWSPPRWMHDNGNYSNGNMKTDSTTFTSYALYLSKFVQGYENAGIHMEAICCQNEPTINSGGYPKCGWSNTQEISFYKNYLIPRMLQDSLISRTKILLGVNCCGTFDTWITPFMNDAVLRPYVAATSHSYQNPDWGLTSWNKYPGVDFWETESGFGGNPPGDGTKQDWSTSASEEWKEVAQFMNNRCAIFTVWNMVNDSANRSGWGWRQYVMITVDQTTTPPKVVYSPYYWAYKHFGYYVKAGAKGIKLTSTGSNPNPTYVSAFRNPNGDIIVCAANLSSTVYPTNVKVGDMYYPVTFPANSFTTVKVVVPTGVQPASLQKSVQQALSKVRLANSTLYFTTSALSGAREMRVVLTDLAGRVIWSGTRAGSALQAGQQAFAVRSSQGGLRSGAYLLSVKVKNAAGVVTNYENKVMSVN